MLRKLPFDPMLICSAGALHLTPLPFSVIQLRKWRPLKRSSQRRVFVTSIGKGKASLEENVIWRVEERLEPERKVLIFKRWDGFNKVREDADRWILKCCLWQKEGCDPNWTVIFLLTVVPLHCLVKCGDLTPPYQLEAIVKVWHPLHSECNSDPPSPKIGFLRARLVTKKSGPALCQFTIQDVTLVLATYQWEKPWNRRKDLMTIIDPFRLYQMQTIKYFT